MPPGCFRRTRLLIMARTRDMFNDLSKPVHQCLQTLQHCVKHSTDCGDNMYQSVVHMQRLLCTPEVLLCTLRG